MNPATAERAATPGAGAVAASERDAATASGLVVNVELLAWLVALAIAAAFRLLDLSALPLAPVEGPRARAALEFSRGIVTPDWGGDLTSALTAISLRLFGDTDATVRLAPAVLGVVAVGLLALYRSLIGRGAAWVAALLLAISPVAVLTARTVGPEAAALPLALLLPPLSAWVFLDGRIERAPVLAAVVGFGLGTGALFLGTALIVAVWLAFESGRDRRAGAQSPLTALRRDRTLLVLTVLAALPGLLLAVAQYGAGPGRHPLAAVAAWSGPPRTARFPETWHYVPDVLLGYEPLVLLLGSIGLVLVCHRWQSASPGDRLAVVWAAAGAALTLFWLHRDPAHLLLLIVPLALLGGVATAWATSAQRATTARSPDPIGTSSEQGAASSPQPSAFRLPAGWSDLLLLVLLVPVTGYTLVMLVRWATAGQVYAADLRALAVVIAAAVVVAGWLVWQAGASWRVLLLAGGLIAGALTLHAAANVAFAGGSEVLRPARTLPEVESVVRRVDAAAPPGAAVWVERRLWPSLAWPLRDRPARQFVEAPPSGPAVLALRTTGVSRTAMPADFVTVTERWAPTLHEPVGLLRWWVFREPWGRIERLGAVVQQ